jgi:hypothetical protein
MTGTMSGPRKAGISLVLAALAGGCSANGMPTLQSLLPPPTETSSVATPSQPYETSVVASGTPTGVFTQVAQGTLGCWFGVNGPLKASHVYHAEAEPPAKGGEAEIVIHERDLSHRDQRGPRAYRISFAGEMGGVRVTAAALKLQLRLAEAMARDVETWAKEGVKGEGGCQLRALLQPPPPVVAKATTTPAKGAASKGATPKGATSKGAASNGATGKNATAKKKP